MKKLFTICSIILFVFATGSATAAITGTLSPDSISATQDFGTTATYTLDYSIDITGGEVPGKADVLFLTDSTGSMGGYIEDMKTALSGVLGAIGTSLPGWDINYGVSDYRNYDDEGNYETYGVNLTQSFTANTGLVQTAIDGIFAGGGGDWEESQFKAMETIAGNWLTASGDVGFDGRFDAQKILIWGGDAPGHVEGDSATGSPPADYYPTIADTITGLNAQGITVFGLNVWGSGDGIDALGGQATTVTTSTGGALFNNVGTGGPSIEDAIVGSIVPGVETLTNITMSLDGTDVPFTVSPLSQFLLGSWTSGDSPVTGSFSFDATAPGVIGSAAFDMVLFGNGAELDRTAVDLTAVPVPGAVLLGILGLSVAGIKLRKHA